MYCQRITQDGRRINNTGDQSTEYFCAHATKLRAYNIWLSDITDRSLELLSGMQSIESLLFYDCPKITDSGVRSLAAAPRLKSIDLQENPNVTPAALSDFDRSVQVNFHPPTPAGGD